MSMDYARIKNVHIKPITLFGVNILESTYQQKAVQLIQSLGAVPIETGLRETVVQIVSDDDEYFAVGLTPFKDMVGETAGVLMFHWRISDKIEIMHYHVALNVIIFSFFLFSAMALLYLSVRKSLILFGNLSRGIVEVSESWDLSKRLEVQDRDEVGLLVEGFNRFLEKLDQMTQQLRSMNQSLEQKVTERTLELQNKVQTIEMTTRTMAALAQHHQLILNSVGEGIYGIDVSETTTFINRAGAAMLGWEASELIGKHLHNIIHHTRVDGGPYLPADCLICRTIRDGESRIRSDEIFWRRDGSSFNVEYMVAPIKEYDGKILGSVVVFRDITERLQAQQAGQQLNSLQRVLNAIYRLSFHSVTMQEKLESALREIMRIPCFFNQSQGGILLLDADEETLCLTAHQGLHPSLLGLCSRVKSGQCLCGRVAQTGKFMHVAEIDDRHDHRFEGMHPHGHYILPLISRKRMLGVLVLYLDHGHLYQPEEEEFLTTIGNALTSLIERHLEDEALHSLNISLEALVRERTAELHNHIASLKAYQEQFVRSERMEALGGMVAGIAHEINTPVGIGYTASMYLRDQTMQFMRSFESDNLTYEIVREYVSSADEATQLIAANLSRADELIKSFKMVAVDHGSELARSIQLKQYIQEIILSLRPKLKITEHRIDVTCPDDLTIMTFPGTLAIILVNLIMNSLTHGFENIRAGHIQIRVTSSDDEVQMVYLDNGCGMEKETVKRIFEPFYTTKRGQGGSGLGMHVVYNQVTQKLGGSIVCQSDFGNGATFILTFKKNIDMIH
ncbi:MAG: PAS domain S-box protein [Magnetococcales bacterium]|nr:PAS domain S-box protein [Magnetococcales bacterium]